MCWGVKRKKSYVFLYLILNDLETKIARSLYAQTTYLLLCYTLTLVILTVHHPFFLNHCKVSFIFEI